MNNLVIGNTSQLAQYFPEDYIKISSRKINIYTIQQKSYDRIYLTFAEQRLHEITDLREYLNINRDFTLKLIEDLLPYANKIIIYGSCELWNNYKGEISIEDPFDYDVKTPHWGYCISKQEMIKEAKKQYGDNVIIIHPFNFNSPYRKSGFLFSKIFNSIINKKQINIGDTYFYRDIVHPKYIVERSINATSDELVGSGRLTHVNDFIRDLYEHMGLKYEDYVKEYLNVGIKKPSIYLKSNETKYTYNQLLNDTLDDVKEIRNKLS